MMSVLVLLAVVAVLAVLVVVLPTRTRRPPRCAICGDRLVMARTLVDRSGRPRRVCPSCDDAVRLREVGLMHKALSAEARRRL